MSFMHLRVSCRLSLPQTTLAAGVLRYGSAPLAANNQHSETMQLPLWRKLSSLASCISPARKYW